MIELTEHAIEGRVPVIAGVGFGSASALKWHKLPKGRRRWRARIPPYYPQADEEGLFEYYRGIAAATDLGILIYSRDWATFSPAMVQR